MQMIGQHDHGICREGMALTGLPECDAQYIDMIGQQREPPVREVDREEEAAPGMKFRR